MQYVELRLSSVAEEEGRHATTRDKRYEIWGIVHSYMAGSSSRCSRALDVSTAHRVKRNREREVPRKLTAAVLTNHGRLLTRTKQFWACDPARRAQQSREECGKSMCNTWTCWSIGQNADKKVTAVIGSTSLLMDNGGDGGASPEHQACQSRKRSIPQGSDCPL